MIKIILFEGNEHRPTATLHKRPSPPGLSPRQAVWALGLITAPALLWGAAISALPHKEERFLFVVYPLVSCPYKPAVFGMVELGSASMASHATKGMLPGYQFHLQRIPLTLGVRCSGSVHNDDPAPCGETWQAVGRVTFKTKRPQCRPRTLVSALD